LVNRYGVLVFEELNVVTMTKAPAPKQDETTGTYLPNGAAAKGGLNKSMLDAGWGEFVTLCRRKAEEAGGTVVRVPPQNTSQECSGCRKLVPKDLAVRWHACPDCGTELDRDHNAARNILRRSQDHEGAGSVPQMPLSSHEEMCGRL